MPRTQRSRRLVTAAALVALTLPSASPAVDPALPAYHPQRGLAGSLHSVGSDTLNVVVTFWAEAFQELHPDVSIHIQGKGSATAPPALTDGRAQLGPMSRPMRPDEVAAFVRRHGHEPTAIVVAVDALAVVVHPDNPIPGLTLAQLDGIFGSARLRGHPAVATWGDVGADGAWRSRPVRAYGRNGRSGTHGFFQDTVLQGGPYQANVREQPGSAVVVQRVARDPEGIGYSGFAYVSAGVRVMPVAGSSGAFIPPAAATSISGGYPLARPLFIYVHGAPDRPLDPLVHQFLLFVLSGPGQELVARSRLFPVPAPTLREARGLLQPAAGGTEGGGQPRGTAGRVK